MPKTRAVTTVSATLSATAGGVHLATHILGWPLSHELLQVITLVAAFVAVTSHFVNAATHHMKEASGEVRATITEEHKILHRSIVAEIESYGQQRAIDGHLAAEQRRVNESRSGQTTVNLTSPDSPARPTNVTPLLRRRG